VVKQSKQLVKMSLVILALFTLVACSSTSDMDETAAMDEGAASNVPSGQAATTRPSADRNQLSQQEIEHNRAITETVFYFDFDIAEFKQEDRNTLTHHAQELASNSRLRVRLEGHADERGTREYNLALGERRANGILNYLIVNGAARSQIEVVSYGEE